MKKKKLKKVEKFIDDLATFQLEHPYEISPTPMTDTTTALDCIVEALLGPNYYVVWPINTGQCNTVIVNDILTKYSKDYRRLIKEKRKELKHESNRSYG